MIKNENCLCHLATGDLLRAAVAAKSPLGMEAKKAMDAGARAGVLRLGTQPTTAEGQGCTRVCSRRHWLAGWQPIDGSATLRARVRVAPPPSGRRQKRMSKLLHVRTDVCRRAGQR